MYSTVMSVTLTSVGHVMASAKTSTFGPTSRTVGVAVGTGVQTTLGSRGVGRGAEVITSAMLAVAMPQPTCMSVRRRKLQSTPDQTRDMSTRYGGSGGSWEPWTASMGASLAGADADGDGAGATVPHGLTSAARMKRGPTASGPSSGRTKWRRPTRSRDSLSSSLKATGIAGRGG